MGRVKKTGGAGTTGPGPDFHLAAGDGGVPDSDFQRAAGEAAEKLKKMGPARRPQFGLFQEGIDGNTTVFDRLPRRGGSVSFRTGSETSSNPYYDYWTQLWERFDDALTQPSAQLLRTLDALVVLLGEVPTINRLKGSFDDVSEQRTVLSQTVGRIADSQELPTFLRTAALRLWAAVDSVTTPTRLLGILSDPAAPPTLRMVAAEAPVMLDTEERVQMLTLIAANRGEDTDLRVTAMRNLAGVPPAHAAGVISELTRLTLSEGFPPLIHEVADEILRVLLDRRDIDFDAPKIRDRFVLLQHRYRRSRDAAARSNILKTAGAWGRLALPWLTQLARSDKDDERDNALDALEKMGAGAAEALALLAIDPNLRRDVSGKALSGLQALQNQDVALFAMARLLNHGDEKIRELARNLIRDDVMLDLRGLGVIAALDPNGRPEIQEFVAGVIESTREYIDRNLRKPFVPAVLDRLKKAVDVDTPLASRSAAYRPTAEQYLQALQIMGLEAWNDIQEVLQSVPDNGLVRTYLKGALDATAKIEVPRAATQLRGGEDDYWSGAEMDLSRMGTYSIDVLLDIFVGDDPKAAERAGEVLARLGVPGYEAMGALKSRPGLSSEVRDRLDQVMERAGAEIAHAFANPGGYRTSDRRFESPFALSLEGLRRGR